MSRENVEVVANSLREFGQTQRPPGVMAPDFVWDMSAFQGWPEEEQYRGLDGFMGFFAKWTEPYDEWHHVVEDVVPVDDDRVVAVVRQRGRLRGADSWVELRFGTVYTVDGGRIRRAQVFTTPQEAFKAVGLRE
jgi:ketosteroid isomerase-like protein